MTDRLPSDALLAAVEVLAGADLARDETARQDALDALAFTSAALPIRRAPSVRAVARVYARDRYQCRYCGQRLILGQVLRLLSRLHPHALAYQENWKTGVAHPIFAALSATLDHITPVTLGGDSLDEANLACACWPCNLRKADLPLDVTGFELTAAPADPTWDGLSRSYRALWEATGRIDIGTHERAWMRAIDAIGH